MLVAFDRIQGMVKAMVGSRPSQAAFNGHKPIRVGDLVP